MVTVSVLALMLTLKNMSLALALRKKVLALALKNFHVLGLGLDKEVLAS